MVMVDGPMACMRSARTSELSVVEFFITLVASFDSVGSFQDIFTNIYIYLQFMYMIAFPNINSSLS